MSENIKNEKNSETKDIPNLNLVQSSTSNENIQKSEYEKLIYNEFIYSNDTKLLPIK